MLSKSAFETKIVAAVKFEAIGRCESKRSHKYCVTNQKEEIDDGNTINEEEFLVPLNKAKGAHPEKKAHSTTDAYYVYYLADISRPTRLC